MKAIVVADENWGIGKDGKLLAHLPGDLKYFKEKTKGKTLVMGRKTLESLPGCSPLPDRKNIILTSDDCFEKDGCVVCNGMDQFFDEIFFDDGQDVFVAGGESIYEQFLPYCEEILVTRIMETFDADRYFINLDESEDFIKTWSSDICEDKGVKYRFEKYERK